MGRGRGKGKKLTSVPSHEDGVEEVIPSYKRRGRPQKPLKDDVDEEDTEQIEEEQEETKKEEGNDVVASNKDIKSSAENANKTKKRDLHVKEDSDSVLEENDAKKSNGFRQNGSRRKSKPRRAAEAGLEFKFHQLPEFDQGKRSCRRRLAGHNERRRKPPSGPLSSRYGRLALSFHEQPSRFRSFLMDFTYPNALPSTGRDAWPTIRAGDRATNSQWHEGLNPNHNSGTVTVNGAHAYVQGNLFNASELPQGECLGGVGSDSGCALSLLSTTQPWGSHSAGNATPTITLSSSGGFDGSSMAPPMNVGNYETGPWGFRVHGSRSSSHEMPHEVGQFSGELELALQGNGPHLDHGSSRGFEPSGHGMNWSL